MLAVFETPIPGCRKLTVQRYVGGLASPLPGFKLLGFNVKSLRVLILTTSWIEVIQVEGIRLGTGNSPPRVQVIKFQCKKLADY
jgi:hypothetical protein